MAEMRFPDNFLWGAATASYQIEGAVGEDGKGESIWDRFCRDPGKVHGGDTGDVACDHYHRYLDDVAMMQEIGLKTYRFSTAWPRIFPSGKGKVNKNGLDFYERLIDALLGDGIEPALTLYHWDLPQALQDRGGWENRDTAGYFSDYAAAMFERFSDRVKTWITHNEPWVVAFVGHDAGRHAPGITDRVRAIEASHVLHLSHAKAVKIFRDINPPDAKIGITLNLAPVYAADESAADAVLFADGYQNRWFLDPVFRGTYPEDIIETYIQHLDAPTIEEGDMDLIASVSVDFLGVNYYMRHLVKAKSDPTKPFDAIIPQNAQVTEMGWEVFPEGLYGLLTRLDRDYDHPELYITENGAAFKDDRRIDGRIDDDDRIRYLQDHFAQAHRAINDGVDLRRYYVWSLMDNFEWAFGYSKLFGIVHVDYKTQNRTWKKSADWYHDVIENNGFQTED